MRFYLLFFLLFSYLFAIRDYLIKSKKVLYKVVNTINTPKSIDSNLSSDEYNIYKTKGHFRVIYGIDYNSSLLTRNLANKILDIANYVWQKEVVEYGFRPPRNSNRYYIDIYIANRDAYNEESGNYINISSYYAGYATAYNNKTPYFVINPTLDDNILKVTLAHEFFHTIQYAYGLDDVNDTVFNKNIWFLEATAVMMEDEVYDDVNDYINYLDYYLPYTNLDIEYYNAGIEYGKVLFAKFIKEKYGLAKIREIFEDYETNETILDDLKKEFNFDELMKSYAYCLANIHTCFEEGRNYPDIYMYSLNQNFDVYHYGIAFINRGGKYLNSNNIEYLQEDFNRTQNKIIDINKTGLIVINKSNLLRSSLLKNNNYKKYALKKGWNLISNIYMKNLLLSNLNGIIIWVYRKGKYFAFSKENDLKRIIIKNHLLAEDVWKKNEGIWVYSDKNLTFEFNYSNLSNNEINFTNEWQILGFSSSFSPSFLNAEIWTYENNKWYYYGKRDFNFSRIEKIIPRKAYFIKKLF